MIALLLFAFLLLAGVYLSDLAERSALSSTVLFLIGGVAAGYVGWLRLDPGDEATSTFVDAVLYAFLFIEGAHLNSKKLRKVWRLPARALGIGLPIALLITAAFAAWFLGIGWTAALVVGAALAPTDPVFASAIVGREQISRRLRDLLNIESGVNDGIALPILLVFLDLLAARHASIWPPIGEAVGGVVLGVVVTWIAVKIGQHHFANPTPTYWRLAALAIALLVFALAHLMHLNDFLAAFAAGITMSTVGSRAAEQFSEIAEPISEMLKLAGVFILGGLVSFSTLAQLPWQSYAFAFAAIVVARPLSLMFALIPSELTWREWVTAAWFGPKGFATVLYGFLLLRSPQLADAQTIFHVIAITVAGSIILHSSTDVPIAAWLHRHEPQTRKARA